MSQEQWTAVDRYFTDTLRAKDEILDAVLARSDAAGLPQINVAPNQGKFLMLMTRMIGARRILEVGTLGGYSTIWLGRGLPSSGHIDTLEANPEHADVARDNIRHAGLEDLVEIHVGMALETLKHLVLLRTLPYDLIFLDADKAGLPDYLQWSLELSHTGTVIIADNVVRRGEVSNPDTADEDVRGAQRYLEIAGADPRLESTAIQTVGSKGYDGFAISVVTET